MVGARHDGLAARLAANATDPASFCAIAGVGFNARLRTDDRLRLGDAGASILITSGPGEDEQARAKQSVASDKIEEIKRLTSE